MENRHFKNNNCLWPVGREAMHSRMHAKRLLIAIDP